MTAPRRFDVRRLPAPVRHGGRELLRRTRLLYLAYLLDIGLRDTGWLRSSFVGRPVTRDGKPLPWYTYAAISFLEARLQPDMHVFEYGTGHSTLWYASRVAKVVSVEHDPSWGQLISKEAPANVSIVLEAEPASYVQEIHRHNTRFDVVVVDGIHRVECTQAAVDNVADDGVIVWDNSDWEEFARARNEIPEFAAFRELPFSGFGPCGVRTWCTSVLYRPENRFGI
jgi:hypothetical protein